MPLNTRSKLDNIAKKIREKKKNLKEELNASLDKPSIKNAMITLGATATVMTAGFIASYRDRFYQDRDMNTVSVEEKFDVTKSLQKKYTISDIKSFEQLYMDALPLINLSMFSTEVLITKPYADNNKTINTIGLGSYYLPEDGDPHSSKWITTAKYIKKYGTLQITGEESLNLVDGWFRYRENGRIYREMFERLHGAQLSINEFAAIATCMYNSESRGKKACDFVLKNWQNPTKCAYHLVSDAENKKFKGILKRATSEACLYLNINDYVTKLGNLRIKQSVTSKNKQVFITSVTQLLLDDCRLARDKLAEGDISILSIIEKKITGYMPKNSESVLEIINKHISDKALAKQLSKFGEGNIFAQTQSYSLYEKALELYNEKNYDSALQTFNKIIQNGGEGADLHSDIAVTYYRLGKYEECIAECRKVLQTSEEQEYAHANYNAALAYEALGNKKMAFLNYKLAMKRNPQNLVYKKSVERLSANEDNDKNKKQPSAKSKKQNISLAYLRKTKVKI